MLLLYVCILLIFMLHNIVYIVLSDNNLFCYMSALFLSLMLMVSDIAKLFMPIMDHS